MTWIRLSARTPVTVPAFKDLTQFGPLGDCLTTTVQGGIPSMASLINSTRELDISVYGQLTAGLIEPLKIAPGLLHPHRLTS